MRRSERKTLVKADGVVCRLGQSEKAVELAGLLSDLPAEFRTSAVRDKKLCLSVFVPNAGR